MDQFESWLMPASAMPEVKAAACNKINITFPREFGAPQLMRHADGYTAFFPENVRMETRLRGRINRIRPIATGDTPLSAMTNLFQEFAESHHYDSIVVTEPGNDTTQLYSINEYPYGTRGFARVKRAETGN